MLLPNAIKNWNKTFSQTGTFRGIDYEGAQYKNDPYLLANVVPVFNNGEVLYDVMLGMLQIKGLTESKVIKAIEDFIDAVEANLVKTGY